MSAPERVCASGCGRRPQLRVQRRLRHAGRNDLLRVYEVCRDCIPGGLCLEAALDSPRPALMRAHDGAEVASGGLPCGLEADWLVVWAGGCEVVCALHAARLRRRREGVVPVALLRLCGPGEEPSPEKRKRPPVDIGSAGWGPWTDPREWRG